MEDRTIKKEDYEEQCCPLKKPGAITPINVRRVLEKLDEYLNANDYNSAERHLIYWLSDARHAGDRRGELTVLNEQVGLYRKMGNEEKSLEAANAAIALAIDLGLDGEGLGTDGATITMATTWLNAATAYKAFSNNDRALELYKKARIVYEKELSENDSRLAGLYNNMATALQGSGQFTEAEDLLRKAIEIVLTNNNKLDAAISFCNLADLIESKGGENSEKQIFECMDKAQELFDAPDIARDGYYAFVADKCAPVFGYYGYFLFKQELEKRVKEIYK